MFVSEQAPVALPGNRWQANASPTPTSRPSMIFIPIQLGHRWATKPEKVTTLPVTAGISACEAPRCRAPRSAKTHEQNHSLTKVPRNCEGAFGVPDAHPLTSGGSATIPAPTPRSAPSPAPRVECIPRRRPGAGSPGTWFPPRDAAIGLENPGIAAVSRIEPRNRRRSGKRTRHRVVLARPVPDDLPPSG